MSDVIETPLPASRAQPLVVAARLDDRPPLLRLSPDSRRPAAATATRRQVPASDRGPPRSRPDSRRNGCTSPCRESDSPTRSAAAELHRLTDALTQELSKIDPPTVSFRSLTVDPEAIYLKAHPADALYPLRARMYRAVIDAIGANDSASDMPAPREFNPHASIAYVCADGQAQPIAEALQAVTTTTVTATFRKASLLEFHRDHRMYEWTSAEPIAIGQ